MTIDYEKYKGRIPPVTLKSLRNYIESGVPTGGFLYSVLTDSLMGTFGQADSRNLAALCDIVMFIHNEAPGDCHGSADHVEEWMSKKRKAKTIDDQLRSAIIKSLGLQL